MAGPLHALLTDTPPGIALAFEAGQRRFEKPGSPSTADVELTYRLHDVDEFNTPRAIDPAGVTGHTAPDGIIDGLFGAGIQSELAQNLARTVGRHLIPRAYAGADSALQAAHKGLTDFSHDDFNINLGVF